MEEKEEIRLIKIESGSEVYEKAVEKIKKLIRNAIDTNEELGHQRTIIDGEYYDLYANLDDQYAILVSNTDNKLRITLVRECCDYFDILAGDEKYFPKAHGIIISVFDDYREHGILINKLLKDEKLTMVAKHIINIYNMHIDMYNIKDYVRIEMI